MNSTDVTVGTWVNFAAKDLTAKWLAKALAAAIITKDMPAWRGAQLTISWIHSWQIHPWVMEQTGLARAVRKLSWLSSLGFKA